MFISHLLRVRREIGNRLQQLRKRGIQLRRDLTRGASSYCRERTCIASDAANHEAKIFQFAEQRFGYSTGLSIKGQAWTRRFASGSAAHLKRKESDRSRYGGDNDHQDYRG